MKCWKEKTYYTIIWLRYTAEIIIKWYQGFLTCFSNVLIEYNVCLFWLVNTELSYIAGNIPGSPGCNNGNGIITKVVSLLLGLFISLLVRILCKRKNKQKTSSIFWEKVVHYENCFFKSYDNSTLLRMFEKYSPHCRWLYLLWPVEYPWHQAWHEC